MIGVSLIALLLGVSYGQTTGGPVDSGALTCGDSLTGSTSPSYPNNYYTFTLATDQYVRYDLCGSDYDTYVWVYDSAWNLINSNDDGGDCGTATVGIDQLTAGTYYLQIGGFSSNTGNYMLQFDCNNGPFTTTTTTTDSPGFTTTASPVYVGSLTCGDVTAGATLPMYPNVYYDFTIDSDMAVNYDLCGSDYDTYVWLYDTSWNLLYSNDDGGDCGTATVGCHDLSAGTYYLQIGGFSDNTGNYALAFTCDGSCYTTNTPDTTWTWTWTPWTTPTLTIDPMGTIDCDEEVWGTRLSLDAPAWYEFTAGSDDYYSFSTCGSNFDTYLWIYDENTLYVASNDDSICGYDAYIYNQWLTAGTYYIGVGGCCSLYSSNYGDYYLNAKCGMLSSTEPPTTTTPPVRGAFYPIGDCKYYDTGFGSIPVQACSGVEVTATTDTGFSTSFASATQYDCDADSYWLETYSNGDCSGDPDTTDSWDIVDGWDSCENMNSDPCIVGWFVITYYDSSDCTGDTLGFAQQAFPAGCQSDGYDSMKYNCEDGTISYWFGSTDCTGDAVDWTTGGSTIDSIGECIGDDSGLGFSGMTEVICEETTNPPTGDDNTGTPGDDGSANAIFCGIAFLVTLIANIF